MPLFNLKLKEPEEFLSDLLEILKNTVTSGLTWFILSLVFIQNGVHYLYFNETFVLIEFFKDIYRTFVAVAIFYTGIFIGSRQ